MYNSYNSGSIINLIYKSSFSTLQLHMLLFAVDVTTLLGSPASGPESESWLFHKQGMISSAL